MATAKKRPQRTTARAAESVVTADDDFLTTLADLWPKRFFVDSWNVLDAEAAAERSARAERKAGYDWRPLIALVVGALMLTAMEYFGHRPTFVKLLKSLIESNGEQSIWAEARDSKFFELFTLIYWSGWRVLGYFVIPALVVKLAFKAPLSEYGLRGKGFSKHLWVYGVFYCIVVVFVVGVSYTESFSSHYPFYDLASRSWADLAMWEVLYAAQFFSLEFFFRGFWLRACKTQFGSGAILAMIVPYCMIHYGKPLPETLGAIFAGIALGTLAMRTRSIWGGIMIHVGIAVSMDVASLLQKGGLPKVLWPE